MLGPKNSSTTSKPTVAAQMNMTSRPVSQMSVLSPKARLKVTHDLNVPLIVFQYYLKDHLSA